MILIDLPDDLAADVEGRGLGQHVVRRRSLTEVAIVTIGLGGSLVSLFQAPDTARALAACILQWSRRTRTVLKIAQKGDGTVLLEVDPDLDSNIVASLLQELMSGSAKPSGRPTEVGPE